ncbi:sigma-70 family RNA polymerase sigma factor [Micromonospora echinofusca]|uniref:Sigma-70 family RNA polymerase sigma factor n=1 Tax=Micromonospora echinofusca TaxID=47858 RepID=A0ABS3VKQ3_MICEH|nr:sigma-70 family RNA polymerase sigma factor [Micromonospora echinofusca]MBO4205107.1 sigma-70 family RNA polymerase sigma factor [Micromonospora echinofusca]
MTAATSSSAPPFPRVSVALADELRVILDRNERQRAQSLVADFVARHHLTHKDVDTLLVMLTRPPATSQSTDPPSRTPGQSSALAETDSAIAAEDRVEEDDPHGTPVAKEVDTAAVSDEETTDDDLDWMFGDAPEQPASPTSDKAVGRAFEDLFGDWTRTGGRLTRAEVALLVTRRGLSAAQHGELLSLLEDAGVDLPASVDARPVRSATKGYELHGDSVRQYLREIGRYPLIGADREVELWSLMRQGEAARRTLDAGWGELSREERRSLRDRVEDGHNAHAELVCANLRLVVSIAKASGFNGGGVEFADRIQEGNLGLMHAAHLFDGSKGYKFSTYATWWIRQHIDRGIANHGRTIRIPVHFRDQIQRVDKAARRLTDRLDREPSLAELAEETGMEPGRVQATLDHMRPLASLDMLLGDEGDLRLSDVLAAEQERDGRTDPAEIVGHAMFHADIDRILRKVLPERAVCVIRRRFGLGTGVQETLDEIGVDYGVTRERIRQIQAKALRTLQEHEDVAALREYVTEGSAPDTPRSTEGEAQ